jgi:hypothetical protein
MRQGTQGHDPNDQLAWLVLRVIDELSSCTEASLLAVVATGDQAATRAQARFGPEGRKLVDSALRKLDGLGFVRLDRTQIDLTDEGRRFLRELPAAALRLDERSISASDIGSDRASALSGPPLADAWRRCVALLARFPAGPLVWRIRRSIVRGHDFALEVWKRNVAPKMRATAPADAVKHLAKISRVRERALAVVVADWIAKNRDLLRKLWHSRYPSINAKLSGLCPVVILVGGLLAVALSTAGGVALLSTKQLDNPLGSTNHPEKSRESPISWSYDGQDPLKRSIFVTRVSDGTTWIEGLSISGENKSNRTLTGVQGVVKWDSGERMTLKVSAAGSQGTGPDAQTVPAGDEFTLGYKFHPDGSDQPGVPAKEFLAANGGVIFKVRYKVADVQTTLIEYLSPSRLKSQLSGLEDTELSQ